MEPLSLVEALASVPDPRKRRGRRHPLTAILSLTVVATLAGCKSLEAIAQFGRDHGAGLAFALGFTRAKTPTKSALSKLFRRLDVAAFEAALERWLAGRRLAGWEAIAFDGKTLKGSADGGAPAVHLLTAFVPAAACVLKQLRVDAKTNEHKAALVLLGVLPALKGKVGTFDAMFTHRDVAQAVRDQDGDYLMTVKDNQPELKEQIRAALDDDAAFSPLPAEAEGGPGADGDDGGQGARPPGGADAAEHHLPERLPGLARRRPGLRAFAGAAAQGGEGGDRGGLRDHQPGPGEGRRGPAAGAGARALGGGEPAALR